MSIYYDVVIPINKEEIQSIVSCIESYEFERAKNLIDDITNEHEVEIGLYSNDFFFFHKEFLECFETIDDLESFLERNNIYDEFKTYYEYYEFTEMINQSNPSEETLKITGAEKHKFGVYVSKS